MCLMIQRHRQTAELLGTRAQVQATVNKEAAEEAYKDLITHYQRVERDDETKKMRERLEQLKDIKEIRFKPLTNTTKKLNLPVVSADAVRASGKLDDQIQLARPRNRPSRARKRRTKR